MSLLRHSAGGGLELANKELGGFTKQSNFGIALHAIIGGE